jgi:hypothetical protein
MPLPYGPPDETLGRELRQVADASLAVMATVAKLNLIPADFPKDALVDLCSALAALPEGTAENCRPQLELARNALPKLRREHFGIDDDKSGDGAPADGPPRLTRGMLLDQQLNDLFVAVSTALDEYRAQAGVHVDDAVLPEDVAVPTEAARAGGIEAKTDEVVSRLRDGVRKLHAHGASETQQGDLLQRRMRDGENLALTARSQILERTAVARWFNGVVVAFRRTPDLIEAAGKALQTTSYAAEPYRRFLAEFLTEQLRTILEQMRGLGEAMEESARRLRSGVPRPDVPTELDPKDLAELARAGLPVSDDPETTGGLRIEATSAFSTDSFSRMATAIRRCSGRLTSFVLGAEDFSDATPLSSLSALRRLDLSGTEVVDLSPLAGLSALQSLNLAFARRVTDLSPLAGLSALQSLNLYSTQLADLSPLAGLSALQSLDLGDTQLADLSPLAGLSALQSLDLNSTRVADLSPLAGLSALQSLHLSGTQVADLSPLAGLSALQRLDLHSTRVADLSPLIDLPKLATLRMHNLDAPQRDAFVAARRARGLPPLLAS